MEFRRIDLPFEDARPDSEDVIPTEDVAFHESLDLPFPGVVLRNARRDPKMETHEGTKKYADAER